MHLRLVPCLLLAAVLMDLPTMAQQQYPPPGNYPPPPDQNIQPVPPNQPVPPQQPSLERRDGQPGPQASRLPPAPPFTLTPEQQKYVRQVLDLWEKRNATVKTFDTRFKRWEYDAVFARPGHADEPKFVDLGVIKYAAPDKGMFRVDTTEKDGREAPIEEQRAQDWKCDGKSIIEYNHKKKWMTVHKLPPEQQGKAIADGPLPFLFGSTAKSLEERYFIRVVTPQDVQDQVWLEAYPRRQQDAANFYKAQLIVTTKMEPYALKLIQPNGKDYVVYQFYETVINDPMRIFRGDPFRASAPWGWKSVVEEPPGNEANRPAGDGRR